MLTDYYVRTDYMTRDVQDEMFPDTEREIVMQETIMSRVGVDRVLKFAFELANKTEKKSR